MPDYEFVVATSDAEREAAFRLRYAIFVREVGAFAATAIGREIDEFDVHSVHFLAKFGDEPVGTVRMQKKSEALVNGGGKRFGLPGEAHYDYTPLERDEVGLAEVSRSCVLPEHRGTRVLANLWKIAYNYSRAQGLTHFMSMGHIGHTDSLLDAGIVYDLLASDGLLHPHYHLRRRRDELEAPPPALPLYSDAERALPNRLKVPASLRLFHRFGLRACGKPVFVPSIGRVGMAMLACPRTFSKSTLDFFHAPDPLHCMG